MRNSVLFCFLLSFLFLFFLVGCVEKEEHVTDIYCDALEECPEGLECWALPGKDLLCVDPNPCEWLCGGECVVRESYPPQIKCEK